MRSRGSLTRLAPMFRQGDPKMNKCLIAILCALVTSLCLNYASSAEVLRVGAWKDIEQIDPQPKLGTSAAVIVADSVPLVHTQQLLVEGLHAKYIQSASRHLHAILQAAGSSLDRIVKLNFVVASDEHQEIL